MRHQQSRLRHLRSALAAGVVLGPALAATGDVIDTLWMDESNFLYRIVHMPDWDQRRLETSEVPGLPNDGSMYCVPTAAMNVLAYIANHGFPETPPEPNNWRDPDTYDEATGNIFLLGLLMGTSPTGGTGWNGWMNGMDAFLPLDKFTYTVYIAGGDYAPSFHDMGQSALNGSLVEFSHGWWSEVGEEGGHPVIERNGGHCLTLTRTYAGLFSNELYARDPADDPANTTQSAYTERIYGVQDRTVVVNGTQRRMSNLQPNPGEWTGRYLDGYAAVRPRSGYSFTDLGLHYFTAYHLWGSIQPREQFIGLGDHVVDLIIGPDLNNLYYVSERDGAYRLHCASLLGGESRVFQVGPFGLPTRLVFGRRRMIYLLSGRQLFLLTPDPDDPEVEVMRLLPGSGDAVAYDDQGDEVAVLDVASRSLWVYPWHLDAAPEVLTLPGARTLPLGDDPIMTWDPKRDAWWIVSEASDDVFGLRPSAQGFDVFRISHEALRGPTSVDVGDLGNVFVVVDGSVLEFTESTAPGGGFTLRADSAFADMTAGRFARVTKCRTNYDPALHDGPEWNNVLPATFAPAVEDCPPDLDFSGVVDFADVLEVLSAWGPCPSDAFCAADLDFGGTVDFADVLEILAAWGPCP